MWILWILLALLAVGSALVIAQLAVAGLIPTIPAAANLGDVGAAYGAASTIISGFAFVAVVVSLVGQKRQILEQKEALTAQTKALTDTSRAQREAAESLQGQLAHMSARARLDDYERRLGRLIEAQAALDDDALDVEIGAEISHTDAREHLGRRHLAALTNLLRELDRLRDDPALAPQAEELGRELKTSLEREMALLYLAVVPVHVPPGYRPAELGRLMRDLDLFPFFEFENTQEGRAAIFLKHFRSSRQA